jgi:protoporphyrinogen oxidase
MKTEPVHTLILGAGPSGLAAGHTLAKAGRNPVILERDRVSGGLMRSIQHGDFILDIGRKELYNRLERVDSLWSEVLGSDYRTYPHRGGILYQGEIIDMSPSYRGVRRGMPWNMFVRCAVDFLWWRVRPGLPAPRNLEEFWYQQRGQMLTRVANQGFQEKLVGRRWVDVPMPSANGHGAGFLTTVAQGVTRFVTPKEPNTYKGIWRHPAKGTGQICDALERCIREAGGRVFHEARVTDMSTDGRKVLSVTAEVNGETITYRPEHLVSSAPVEFLQQMLLQRTAPTGGPPRKPQGRRRVVIVAYLLLNEPPRFPHFWLQVTDPELRAGRIANFAALNADMVPPGKTCLSFEYYCFDEDPMLAMTDQEVADLCLREATQAKLVDPEKCFDRVVLRFPGADASQNRHNWFSKERQQVYAELRRFENLYSVNRTDLDISTLAGIEGAEAILSGDRTTFDRHFDPAELGIRSESKPFEFRNPPGVQI